MTTLRVAVAGLGAIGWPVVQRLDAGIAGLRLTAVSARDRSTARARVRALATPVTVTAAGELAGGADVVVEALPAAAFREVAVPTLAAGRTLLALSAGALLEHDDLIELARREGGRIHVPSGALAALDGVRAAAQGTIHGATIRTRKPPGGLAGAPYLDARGFEPAAVAEPTRVFAGSAREAARGFPANVNVAAALALAGIGADRTNVEIWADPTVTRNTHEVEVDADSTRFKLTIEGVPSEANPRTGKLTPLAVLAALEGLVAPLHVGT